MSQRRVKTNSEKSKELSAIILCMDLARRKGIKFEDCIRERLGITPPPILIPGFPDEKQPIVKPIPPPEKTPPGKQKPPIRILPIKSEK